MGKSWEAKYITYGKTHLPELREKFRKEMVLNDLSNWLYNGGQIAEGADLGYFMGYEICKSYYNLAEDKLKAVKEIIELNYNDDQAVEAFLHRSKFFD